MNVRSVGKALLRENLILSEEHIKDGLKEVEYIKEGEVLPLVIYDSFLCVDTKKINTISRYVRTKDINISVIELKN